MLIFLFAVIFILILMLNFIFFVPIKKADIYQDKKNNTIENDYYGDNY